MASDRSRDGKRGCGVTCCSGCLCDTCANSVELPSWYVTIGEAEEPCFSCDECRHYDGDLGKPDKWHGTCSQHIEAEKAIEARAQNRRATFKIIKGGRNELPAKRLAKEEIGGKRWIN